MTGLMQEWPLTVDRILEYARSWHGHAEVVTRSAGGALVRSSYIDVHARAKRVSNVLTQLGIVKGDRVATLAWNNARHLEVWYGIMGMGVVCHTLNPRLFAENLIYIINEAQDRLIFVEPDLLPILTCFRDRIPSVERFIVLGAEDDLPPDTAEVLCYERLLSQASAQFTWGGFNEETAAGLCFTSGTTGNPKGVLYSHRSNFLHTLISIAPDALGLSARDTVLPIVPMFHANGWGLAFSAPAVGAKLVLPGHRLDGPSVHELLEREAVTFSAAVPTVWQQLLLYLRSSGSRLSTLQRVVIGGAAVPEYLIREFRDDHGVEVIHAWGMTEMSPLGTVSRTCQSMLALSSEERFRACLKQGRPPLGVEMKLTDDAGNLLPHDGATAGRLKVRGPAVARSYWRAAAGWDTDGFFDTGDVATLDEHGVLDIVDRTKDVIKSGGEWISSVAIETAAVCHPAVALAAALGVPHPKWGERPCLFIALHAGESLSAAALRQFLSDKLAKWCIPDEVVFVADIPLGATGKVDKKALRQAHVTRSQ